VNALPGRVVATGVAWLMVTASGAQPKFTDGDDWQLAYAVFGLSLLVAAVLTLWLVLAVTAASPRLRLRNVAQPSADQ
jgi:hypothetical protein